MKKVLFSNLKSNTLALPTLQSPLLSNTVEQYANSLRPIKRGPALDTHFDRLSKFVTGSSKDLHNTLEALTVKNEGHSHLSWGTWRDDEVLRQRKPLPVHSSVAVGFKRFGAVDASAFDSHVVLKKVTQAELAAEIISSVVRFVCEAGTVGVAVNPSSDASNIADQFCSSRIPLVGRDEIFRGDWEKDAEYVAILRDGHVYFLRVYFCESKKALDTSSIKKAIDHILSVTPLSDNSAPVSALTALNRDDAAAAFMQLSKESPRNVEELEMIQKAIVVICLDTEVWPTPEAKQRYMLFGGEKESESRWYHKNQIIISADGEVAVNYDRALTDRHSASVWCSAIFDDVQNTLLAEFPEKVRFSSLPPLETVTLPATEIVRPMNVVFGKAFAGNIRVAKESAKQLAASVSVDYVRIPTITLDMHSDAFMQTCFQLAYFMLHHRLAPASHEISLSSFFNGGMAYIRTGTAIVQPFLELWAQREKDPNSVAVSALAKALHDINDHYLAKLAEVGKGEGVDEHLHALEYVATVKEARNPKFADAREFFADPLFKAWDTPTLATGSISATFADCYSFGPQTHDGFGLGYVIHPSYVLVSITSFHEDKISAFRDEISKAAKIIHAILDNKH